MAIERWQPFSELMSLRQAMDKLFEDSFVRPSRGLAALGEVGVPALDLYQTPNELVVEATLPGLKPEDVTIDITGETLTIKGRDQSGNRRSRKRTIYTRRDAMAFFPGAWPFPAGLRQTSLRQRWKTAF